MISIKIGARDMGGDGSTRWQGCEKKDTVENCRILDANRWTRSGILQEGIHRSGRWVWRNARTGGQTASIDYEVDTKDMSRPWIWLHYTFTEVHESVDYRIRLQTTQPRWGGLRWWFTCDLSINGRVCRRRVGKLYLPLGARYFGCRHCYDLTYRSCQTSDKRVLIG